MFPLQYCLLTVLPCFLLGCEQLNSCLDCLALEYPSIRFCRMDAVATGAVERFTPEVSKLSKVKQQRK